MEGFCHQNTRLWDVTLKELKNRVKLTHKIIAKMLAPGIYLPDILKQKKSSPFKRKVLPKSAIPTDHSDDNNSFPFGNMNAIIDDNADYYNICQQQIEDNKMNKCNSIFKEFHGMHQLIDDTIADTPINPRHTYDGELNVILRKDVLKCNLAAFHHGTIFATTKKPFVQAIGQNFFSTFPGLTPELINCGAAAFFE